jgi:ABC-type uncharacterized transport system substrate-binding protein
MKRREFITLLGGAAACPFTTHSQQPAKLLTIGFLGSSTLSAWSDWVAAFVQRLRQLGWIEGHTIAIEYRWADGRSERFTDMAAEFVRMKVDIIVTGGTAVLAVKRATSTIPIVFPVAADRFVAAWLLAWRDRAVTSPACRPNRTTSLPSESGSCARCCRVFAGWRSSAMSAIPAS